MTPPPPRKDVTMCEICEQTLWEAELDEYEECCDVCGAALEWDRCPALGCDDGLIGDLYDDDPFRFKPGAVERCFECDGYGGWWYCPNAANHEALQEQDT